MELEQTKCLLQHASVLGRGRRQANDKRELGKVPRDRFIELDTSQHILSLLVTKGLNVRHLGHILPCWLLLVTAGGITRNTLWSQMLPSPAGSK